MNNNKIIAVFAVVVIVLAGAGIVYLLTRDDGSDGNTITDARGRKVAVPEEIDSILAMKSCSLQLVSFFDAVEKVTYLDGNTIGTGGENLADPDRTHTFIMNDLFKGLPFVDTNNPEAVMMTKVDIIISSDVSVSTLNEFQAKVGIPVFAVNADVEFDSPFMYEQLLSLGKLFGEEERAQELVDGIKSMIDDITDNVSHVDGFAGYVCGMNYYGIGTFLKTSGDYLPFKYSKLDNVMPPKVGGQPYDTQKEIIAAKNPQVIFIDGIRLSAVIQDIKNDIELYQPTDAVSNGEIYKTMVYKDWGTNWVNLLINVYYVASVVHVGDFDWTFEDKADEIIQLFYPGTDVTYSDLADAQTGGGCGKVLL
ncbi:MAG: ABC transporter substrate-binding protein [Methanomassiliicoccaceae archaeon]|nr:ABC transporter substrate-binding protein [Methanomassiliicoccaceae archaeon]